MDYVKETVECVQMIHEQRNHGHILVFVTGVSDIKRVMNKIRARRMTDLHLYPLYASLAHAEKNKFV